MAFTNVALVRADAMASLADPTERPLASGENIEAGKLGIIFLATDNAATVDGASTTHDAITDTSGNTWTKLGEHTSTDGAALDGCTISLWISEIATALTGGVGVGITFDFTSDPGNDAIAIIFKCDYTGTPTLDTVVHAIDANSAVVSGRTSREYLAIGTHGAEGESLTYTEDTDYTSVGIQRSTGGGANNVNIYGFAGYRIATLTGDTYGPTPPESLNRITSLWFLWDDTSGGTEYDETGKTFTITSTLAITEQVIRGELGKTVSISSTVSATDVATFVDDKTISMALTLALTDVATFLQDLGFTINATITGTDAPVMVETGKQISVTATITETDAAVRTEDALVTVTATLTETDVQTMEESGRALDITATIAGTDGFSFTEVLALSILATIAETDDLVPGGGGGGITPNSWAMLGILREMCEARGLTPGDLLAALNRLAGTSEKDAVAALRAMGATSGEIVGAINELAGGDPKELIGALRAWAASGNF